MIKSPTQGTISEPAVLTPEHVHVVIKDLSAEELTELSQVAPVRPKEESANAEPARAAIVPKADDGAVLPGREHEYFWHYIETSLGSVRMRRTGPDAIDIQDCDARGPLTLRGVYYSVHGHLCRWADGNFHLGPENDDKYTLQVARIDGVDVSPAAKKHITGVLRKSLTPQKAIDRWALAEALADQTIAPPNAWTPSRQWENVRLEAERVSTMNLECYLARDTTSKSC
jgi:hypothetical protein